MEIIVVLVILAVLAAFTIPSMLGFVNEARGKAYLAEAREVYIAAQATATEYVANGTGVTVANLGSLKVYGETGTAVKPTEVTALTMYNYLHNDITTSPATAEPTTATDSKAKVYWEVTMSSTTGSAQVTQVLYIKDGYKITLTEPAGTSTVEKLPATV